MMGIPVQAAPLGRITAPSPLSGVLLQGPASPANLGIEMAASKPVLPPSISPPPLMYTGDLKTLDAKIKVLIPQVKDAQFRASLWKTFEGIGNDVKSPDPVIRAMGINALWLFYKDLQSYVSSRTRIDPRRSRMIWRSSPTKGIPVQAAPLGRITAPSPLSGVLLQGSASPANLGIEMAEARPLAEPSIGGPDLGAVTEEQAAAIGAKIDAALAKMDEEMNAVEVEHGIVSDPDLRKSIVEVGPYFDEPKFLAVLMMNAEAIMNAAMAFSNGVAGTYFTMAQQEKTGEINGRAQNLVDFVKGDAEALGGEDERLAQLHMATHMDPVEALVKETEQAVVAAESGGIGVREPAEKMRDILIGGGILAAGGALAVILLS